MSVDSEKRRMKEEITTLLRRVPNNVINGNVDMAREWKKFYASTMRDISKFNVTLPFLESTLYTVKNRFK